MDHTIVCFKGLISVISRDVLSVTCQSLDSYSTRFSDSAFHEGAVLLRQYRQHEVSQKSHQHILLGYGIISSKPKNCNEIMRKRGMRDVSEEILSLFVAIRFQGSSTKPCPNEKPTD